MCVGRRFAGCGLQTVACPVVLMVLLACGPHRGDPDTDPADTDVEADGDTDADTDTDADADGDTDTDGPFVVSCDTSVEETGPCTVDADGDGTYLTIQEAVDAASEGDVITVCPGVYDSIVVDRVGVALIGYGPDSTCIIGTTEPAITIDGTSVAASPPRFDVDLSGFALSGRIVSGSPSDAAALDCVWSGGTYQDLRIAQVGSAPFAAAVASMCEVTWERVTFEDNEPIYALDMIAGTHTIRHSVFRRNDGYAVASYDTSLAVTNSIFSHNGSGIDAIQAAGTIANNVFYSNRTGIGLRDGPEGPVMVRNNVALGNTSGYAGTFYDADYNVAWDNGLDYSGSTPGAHDLHTDPLFQDPAAGDFRLQSTSQLIDAGDPAPAFSDSDGSQNDIGAFGGPYGSWSPP
jgi:hypothetical protein